MCVEQTSYNVLDLFCGAGGLSRGFMDAGFNVAIGVDFDDMALKTFAANHKNSLALKLDLFNHDNIKVLQNIIKDNGIKIDVLVGGPPCQGFSLAGPRRIDDSRNKLYQAMVKTAAMLKPKVVVLENVPGIVQLHGGMVGKKIISDFTALGYRINYKILYAPDYGIPQTRKRTFFVGLLNAKENFVFPTATVSKDSYVTCEQAIGDLPSLEGIRGEEVQNYPSPPISDYQKMMRAGSSQIYNHIGTIHDAKTIKYLAMIPEGKNYKALPKRYSGIYKYHEALTRYNSQKPSPTINTGHRSHFHYKWLRIPTVRESARLQSFRDDFIFFGNKSQQYRQVGNAVPPMLGNVIAMEILKWLKRK